MAGKTVCGNRRGYFFVRILPSLLLFYGAAGAFGSASAAGECGGENQREQYDRERHPEEKRERAAACESIVIALEVDEADNGGHDVCHVAAQAVGQAFALAGIDLGGEILPAPAVFLNAEERDGERT